MERVAVSAPDKTPARIAGMFDAIAPRYDLLNHLLTAGLDRRWRARAIHALNLPAHARVVDLCTGRDLAIQAAAGSPGCSAWISPRHAASRSQAAGAGA
jgi:ubiquinone/menaquinone biosynthesis C-methylase UbiE